MVGKELRDGKGRKKGIKKENNDTKRLTVKIKRGGATAYWGV